MKYEWRKKDKNIYLPKEQPTIVTLPKIQYLMIEGEGNPNGSGFSQTIEALYAYSYALKMSPRKGIETAGYYDYTVFPLEAFWDSKVPVVKGAPLDKDQLLYCIMIRQPEFITEMLVEKVEETVAKKVPKEMRDRVFLRSLEEGRNLQILHVGSYDDEPRSFQRMSDYCDEQGLERIGHVHKEIYLSDARKVAPDKLKTVLRFPIK
ncbi:GyrI-like domain-containing protein [Carnobacterium antarcticum]|uniref:GyrI-like domain-containing protein n=1 Tax=Carnobacterium antarcticum TaxID=2126436 RepID=A0ABW4NJI5_9LACT|nr:GyrI-like domain-containing protein [Carnobacterium sp. CP1]ALV22407.1 hypothetical protein NY10_1809 [Carnobacterium sp. CP1]